MDDTPRSLLGELRSSILKKRVGQIALAVVLAQAVFRLLSGAAWYLIIPLIGKFFHGQSESVLFEKYADKPIAWETLFGFLLEFVLTVILVLYLNRWIQRRPSPPIAEPAEEDSVQEGT